MLNADNKQKSDNPSNTKQKKRHTSRRVDRENIRNRRNDMEKPAQAKTEVIHERDQELPAYVTNHIHSLFPNQLHRNAWIHDLTCRPVLDQASRRLLCRLANINTYKNKEKLVSLVAQIKSKKTLSVLLTAEEMEICNRDAEPELMLVALQCYKVDKATEIHQFYSVLFHLNFAMQTSR